MTREFTQTALQSRPARHSQPVEDLINRLIRDGSAPASEVAIARPVAITEDESGGDPYNHTGRFRKIFK
jgi:hypothetical protein